MTFVTQWQSTSVQTTYNNPNKMFIRLRGSALSNKIRFLPSFTHGVDSSEMVGLSHLPANPQAKHQQFRRFILKPLLARYCITINVVRNKLFNDDSAYLPHCHQLRLRNIIALLRRNDHDKDKLARRKR